MKPGLLRTCTVLFTMLWITTVVASAAAKHPKHASLRQTSTASDPPLIVFQSIDKHLTAIDRDNEKIRASAHNVHSVGSAAQQKLLVQRLQHSKQQRDRLQSVNQLLAISSRAERRYHNRRQAYGATLFRELHGKASSVRTALLRGQTAPTIPAWSRAEKLVNTRVLSLITQFQAISGGYVALACDPGSWACCQPRTERNGKVVVRGCTWSCASKLAACRGGCLGRRTPNTVVAVRNTPKPPVFAHSPAVASSQVASKRRRRVHAPSAAEGSASGR